MENYNEKPNPDSIEKTNSQKVNNEEEKTQQEKEDLKKLQPAKTTSPFRAFFDKIELKIKLKKRAEHIKTKTADWMRDKTADTQKIKTKIKHYAKNIGILLITLFIIFLLFEIGVRLTEPYSPPPPKRNMLITHSTYSPFLIFGPSFLQTNRQGEKVTMYTIWNPQGFRLPENIPYEPPDDEYRIFAMGGSTTEDMANKQNIHYCGVAEGLLGDMQVFGNKKPRCINAGSSGYSSAHALVRLQFDILNFKPQMITVMHAINDLTVSYFPYNLQNPKLNYANKYLHPSFTEETNLKKLLLGKSKAWTKLQKKLKTIRLKLFAQKIRAKDGKTIYSTMRFTNESSPLMTRLFYNNLKSMVAIAKEHNITVVLMSEPAVFTDEKIALLFGHEDFNKDIFYPPKEQLQLDLEVYNAVVKRVAKEEKVYFVDMYNLMGHDERFFVDMAHYSAEGSQRFGYIYAEELKKILEEEERRQKTEKEFENDEFIQKLGKVISEKGIEKQQIREKRS